MARLAGVHKSTASRALNPATSTQVKTATAPRVLRAARQLASTPGVSPRRRQSATGPPGRWSATGLPPAGDSELPAEDHLRHQGLQSAGRAQARG
ncbi:LacI family DNA-binding transcriptional regulator [Streptomyces sp. NPDC001156]